MFLGIDEAGLKAFIIEGSTPQKLAAGGALLAYLESIAPEENKWKFE